MVVDLIAQEMPLVYDVENTGADYPTFYLPSFSELPVIPSLPDPFEWADSSGRIVNRSDWRRRRAEIGAELQQYELGTKPARPDTLEASFSADSVLKVTVIVGGDTLTLTSKITLPAGDGPFPAVIGVGFSPTGSLPPDIFTSRGIATIQYMESQITNAWSNVRGDGPFFNLYKDKSRSKFVAWAWGINRIIDGLEKCPEAKIDLKHLAITGCSYAGKIALFSGALDERIALTIPIESGGGGDATWRFSQTIGSSVEILSNAQGQSWYYSGLSQFNNAVTKLPYDHHEVMAMIAPRALFVTGNPPYVWLADESGYVGCMAAKEVWKALGIPDRFGFSKVGGHDHCTLPDIQRPEVGAFVDKFLLGKDTTNTNISTNPGYTTDLSSWITWTTPTLSNDTSLIEWASLSYPSNLQTDLDTTITFLWKKVQDAEKYFIQVSLDPAFTNLDKSDSTTTDTVKTFTGLLKHKKYYWRVKVKSPADLNLWSNIWSFSTITPLPAVPKLVSATPTLTSSVLYTTYKWNTAQYADQYLIQVSKGLAFDTIYKTTTTSDTFKSISGHYVGQKYYWRVQAINITGSSPWSDVWNYTPILADVKEEEIPTEYSLSQNYPNPFNPTTKIKFALPQTALTKIIIYDLLGREVQTLINKELEAGYHEINFEASNFQSGVYFYSIRSGDFIQTKKMVLMK
jgi:hypothetical protein